MQMFFNSNLKYIHLFNFLMKPQIIFSLQTSLTHPDRFIERHEPQHEITQGVNIKLNYLSK